MENKHFNIKDEIDFNDFPLISIDKEEKVSKKENDTFQTMMQIAIKQENVLGNLLEKATIIDFDLEANGEKVLSLREKLKNANDLKTKENIEKEILKMAPNNYQKYVLIIHKLLKLSVEEGLGMGLSNNHFFYYNKHYWENKNHELVISFLGDFAQKSGINKLDAQQSKVKTDLFKQFETDAQIPDFNKKSDEIRIPLKNGTLIFNNGNIELTDFKREHFLKYQLEFEYDPKVEAPLFQKFLNRVLPDKKLQDILLEFLGNIFLKDTKNQKMLLLYGTGCNGKSVVNDVIQALLGKHNITSFSIPSLCNEGSKTQSYLENNLLNYSQEFGSGKYDVDILKTLISNHPHEVRRLYENPYTMENYGPLASNCNVLPRISENNHAFFRRFIIIPFKETISDEEIDINLANKIIQTELSGVFNMLISGMKRLKAQKKFTESKIVNEEIEKFRKDSNSILSFLDDENYVPSKKEKKEISIFFQLYKDYCSQNNFHAFSSRKFNEQLRSAGYEINRSNQGYYYINYEKKKFDYDRDGAKVLNDVDEIQDFLNKMKN